MNLSPVPADKGFETPPQPKPCRRKPQFQFVQEWKDAFLALFPHRYDYIWANHPNPGEKPDWQTEIRHPLSDRLIKQGAFLHGVRFGSTTNYVVIDLDRGSCYNPVRDPLAWRRIKTTLEPLGLVRSIPCTSSASKGLHLYFPFDTPQKTWAIALAVSTLLENAGFKLAPGQLEVFPNRKSYAANGEVNLYNGHRLPMQVGSYLLTSDLEQIWGDQDTFVTHWELAQRSNQVDAKTIEQTIKESRRKQYRITGKADKFLNDLSAEIEQGWTSFGQTNRLLGRIAMRSYIFGHVCGADTPLAGTELIDDIIKTAIALPGYEQWCQHQHEIEDRAKDWATCTEKSKYFHYGFGKRRPDPGSENQNPGWWNEQQEQSARGRIRQAMADLLNLGTLPSAIGKRFKALTHYGISGSTLYRHRDLWHPEHLEKNLNRDLHVGGALECNEGALQRTTLTSLLEQDGRNTLPSGTCDGVETDETGGDGCNKLPDEGVDKPTPQDMTREEGIAYIKGVLDQIKARRQAEKLRKKEEDGG
jgi:hypothetical protein